jgi:hypothetical protein
MHGRLFGEDRRQPSDSRRTATRRLGSHSRLSRLASGLLLAVGSSASLVIGTADAADNLRLTTRASPLVRRACADLRGRVSIQVTCPILVPVSRYVTRPGLWGGSALDGLDPDAYMLTFNNGDNGDNGQGYIHWIAGAGRASSVRRFLLTDERNVVKGQPRLLRRRVVAGRHVEEYRYPSYPAGGPNGGHEAVFVRCGPDLVYASIHGEGNLLQIRTMALDLARRRGCPISTSGSP